ncbi:MAG: FAD-dependent oxidoreductase, partial [Lentisphaeria bacterium]|nr:FAD-dependent oxidoreductase [Lentisphaeria bacterium]
VLFRSHPVHEPARDIPVIHACDLCVVGGSCTGVFAALRAARLGAKVVLLEKSNRLGGVATLGLVGMWHSLFDITRSRQIIGGLTFETLERLEKTGACSDFRQPTDYYGIRLNSEELTLELDAMVMAEKNITLYLQTSFSQAVMAGPGQVEAIVAEDKSGRFAIRAGMFIDASGDGVLARRAGLAMRRPEHPQPPTSCARFSGWSFPDGFNLRQCMDKYREELPDLPCGYSWGMAIPNSQLYMLAGTRVLQCDCNDADEITRAELTARRQIRAILAMLRREFPDRPVCLEALPSAIGIREGLHIESVGTLTGEELLAGRRFPDAIGNGTYPVDIHNDTDATISFKSLDGTVRVNQADRRIYTGRWLPEGEVLPFYQMPLSCLIPRGAVNVLVAGRMLDADRDAFGAVRVMVNLNQCGEAAGVAAWQAGQAGHAVSAVDPAETRRLLRAGGSMII